MPYFDSIQTILGKVYPVGCIYTSTNSTNPATSLGFGTWAAFGAGRVPVGFDSLQTEFDTDEETGGAKTATLAQANLPNISTGAGTAHTHVQDAHGHTVTNGTSVLRSSITGGTYTGGANTFGVSTLSAANTTATNQNESAHTHSLGGSGTALSIMNPYITVRMWKRTA